MKPELSSQSQGFLGFRSRGGRSSDS